MRDEINEINEIMREKKKDEQNFKHNSKVPTYPCYMYEMMINKTVVNKLLETKYFC